MNIKIETTNKALSSIGGINIFSSILNAMELGRHLTDHFPTPKISTKTSPFEKFKSLCVGLVAGADCLDDMEKLAHDPAFSAVNGHVNAANTYGQFLRSFSRLQCKKLNLALIDSALKMRSAVEKKASDFILDIDSTPHHQCGQKMEGVEFNYKNDWCLDSLQAYDNYGFMYWMDVRRGGTFTANGSSEVIHSVMSRVSKKKRKYLRADSGYCNVDVFNAARTANAGFAIAMRQNMFAPLIHRVKGWKKAKKTVFYDGRKCEVGHTLYYPKRGHEVLRVVFIRALRPREQRSSLFDDARYDYCAWVSNIGHHEMTNEELIEFYRKRGHAENYIKEAKNGFDLKHLPCRKLLANKAYGLIGAFAYNIMRRAAYILDARRPNFSKIIRFRMLNIACQVVRHARSVSFRFSEHSAKEVQNWITRIQHQKFAYG